MNVLEIIFDRTLSVLLMTFTYLIPLLSSIRAVHHKDLQAYQQWLTYFLLIFLFHPICAILRIHKLFRLLIVLYLSLPKFQGALFVYQEVIHVLLERYAVERKVDEHLDKFKTSIRARLWNIAKDIGWSALTQVGEVVSFVKDTVGHKEDLDEDGHDATSKRNILKKEDDLFVNSTIKRNPSHSVLESWSSFCSQEGSDQTNCNLNDIPFHERESYVQDFLAMLREGLYVFAAQYSAPTIDDKEKREEASKIFRLRVFFYQDSFKNDNVSSSKESADISNDHAKCKSSPRFFVFQSVEQIHSHEANHQDDVEVISMDDIHEIQRTSANGIEFLCTVANILEESVSTSSSTGETANDANITTTINATTGGTTITLPSKKKVLAEIVLSSHEDRETLFLGLNACLSWFRQSDEEEEEKEKRLEDDDLDNDGLCLSLDCQKNVSSLQEIQQERQQQQNDSLRDAFMEDQDHDGHDDTYHEGSSDDDANNGMKRVEQHQSSVDILEEMNDICDVDSKEDRSSDHSFDGDIDDEDEGMENTMLEHPNNGKVGTEKAGISSSSDDEHKQLLRVEDSSKTTKIDGW